MLSGRHLIQPDDLTVSEIEEICSLAEQIIVDPKSFQDVCRGKILATLFFEPSTRTRLSFEAAMLRLGGSVEGFSDADLDRLVELAFTTPSLGGLLSIAPTDATKEAVKEIYSKSL